MLNIIRISKSFDQPSGERLVVLQEVSLLLRAQEVMALMGPNGSGKTTLLNIIGGETCPDAGSVELGGENLIRLEPHRRYRKMGRVHQESYKGLAIDLTVGELIAVAQSRNRRLRLRRVSPASAIEDIFVFSPDSSKFLDFHRNHPARLLSGGQRQFLSLLLAVLGHPTVLLLDEHLSSLDEQYSELADSLLFAFVRAEECAILVVTHSRAWAEASCTRIGELRAGRLEVLSRRDRNKEHANNDSNETT